MENSTEEKRIKFIQEIAKSKIPNATYHKTFIEVFGHFRDADIKIDKTQGTHLTKIYQYFEKECPNLQTIFGKGKKEVLRKHLQDLFNNTKTDIQIGDRPQPLTNSQNILTPEPIPELTTLEFIGRDRDLTNLASLSKQLKIILIKAGAGVGKSTLAKEFLHRYFQKVIEINLALSVDENVPASEKLPVILKELNQEISNSFALNLDCLKKRISDRNQPSVAFLIDNLEPALDNNFRFLEKLSSYEALLNVLGDRDVCSFTLITSRRSLITPRARVQEYSLEGLDITAWRQYFHDCENGADSEALMQMHDAYNGNAKVMDILHATIKNPNRFDGNIAAYWSRYKDALLADSELETLISVEMDWLRDNEPDAYKLLCRMGCYRYQDVKTVPFEGLICLLWDVPESRHLGVVDYLSKTSLIEVRGEYYLHPAVREASKLHLLDNNSIEWEIANKKAAKFWTNCVQKTETINDALKVFEAYHHYLQIGDMNSACEVLVKERGNRSHKIIDSREVLGYSFRKLGQIDLVITSIEQTIKNIDNDVTIAKSLNLLGNLLWLKGRVKESLKYYSQLDLITSRLYESNKESNSQVINEIRGLYYSSLLDSGLCHLSLYEIEEAHRFFLRLHESYNHINDIADRQYLSIHLFRSCFCLSLTYSLMGLNYRENALSLIKKVIKSLSDPNELIHGHQTNGLSRIFVAKAYLNIGLVDDALETYYLTVKYAQSINYRQIEAMSLCGLSEIQRIQGQFENSLQNIQIAINILKEIGAILEIAQTYFQLGLTYQAMGEHDQAEKYKTQALELFAQMEAPKQIERVNQAFGGNIQ